LSAIFITINGVTVAKDVPKMHVGLLFAGRWPVYSDRLLCTVPVTAGPHGNVCYLTCCSLCYECRITSTLACSALLN